MAKTFSFFTTFVTCFIVAAGAGLLISQTAGAARPHAADVMPSGEYRTCLDHKIQALPRDATFFPAVRGQPTQEYLSTSFDEMQLYFHKDCLHEFQAWLVRDCLNTTGHDAQACVARDMTIITDEINQLGLNIFTAYYDPALGTGLMVRKAAP